MIPFSQLSAALERYQIRRQNQPEPSAPAAGRKSSHSARRAAVPPAVISSLGAHVDESTGEIALDEVEEA